MKYIFGFLVTVLLIIVLIVLLVTGGNDKPKVPNTSKTLESYASTTATARLTIDGPINAPEMHQATRITVGRDATVFEQLVGYDGQVIKMQTFPNTATSYKSFLRAIDLAGFTKGDDSENLKNDRGVCPLGNRYIFEFEADGKQLERYWSTSCNGAKSFQGKTNLNLSLFQRQVPGYSKLNARHSTRLGL